MRFRSKFAAKKWISLLMPLATPLAVAVVGYFVTDAIKTRELKAQYVQLAIAVLREQPRADTKDLREWAIHIVNEYAPIKLTRKIQDSLASDIYLPGAALLTISPESLQEFKKAIQTPPPKGHQKEGKP